MDAAAWINDPEVRAAYIYRDTGRSLEAAVSDALYVWDPYMNLQCEGAAEYRRALESARRVPAAFPAVIASSMRLMERPDDADLVKEETAILRRTVRRCSSLSGLIPFRDAAELRRACLYVKGIEALGGVYDDSYVESVLSVQRALASELAESGELVQGPGRDITVCLDGSDGMQGEPSILSKAFVLMLVRLFAGHRRIDVTSTCDGCDWSFGPGRSSVEDTIRLLMFMPGDGEDCGYAVRSLLNGMRQDRLHDRDLIIVSQAKGLVNSVALHDDWVRFREAKDVRTFSVIPGTDCAKGLTELSDGILYLKPAGRLEKDGSFTAFVLGL